MQKLEAVVGKLSDQSSSLQGIVRNPNEADSHYGPMMMTTAETASS
jgi:hypothetical protein